MKLDEALAAKTALRERIKLALKEFSADTGLPVESVNVNWSYTLNGEFTYYVDAEVRL